MTAPLRVPAPADPVRYVAAHAAALGDSDLRLALALALRYPGALPVSVAALAREVDRAPQTVEAAADRLVGLGVAEWVPVGKSSRRLTLVVADGAPTQAPLKPTAPTTADGAPWNGAPPEPKGAQAELFGALATLCYGVVPNPMSAQTRLGLAAAARRIRKAGGTAGMVAGPVTEAWARDWRGKRGSRPTLAQIEDLVGVHLAAGPAPGDSDEDLVAKAAWGRAMSAWVANGGPASGKPKPAPFAQWRKGAKT